MDACALYPVVDNEPSKLYMELLEKTGKDRSLTNLLYSLSLQPLVKNLFSHSDLNSQGEPASEAVIRVLGVEKIISSKSLVAAEAKKIGALDKKGNKVFFDEPNSLIETVLDFNDTHDTMKAVIRYSESGYFIEVDTINANNFNSNNRLKSRQAIYTDLLNRFQDFGLNTDFSAATLEHFNVLNVRYQIKALSELKKGVKSISEDRANLLLDLFESEPLVERLFNLFGDDTAKAISQISGWNYRDDALDIDATQRTLIENLLLIMKIKLKKVMNSSDMEALIANAEASFDAEETMAKTSGLDVQHTLNELYRDYHIDQESLDLLQKKVRKVSDAANKLLQIRLARMGELNLKGVSTPKEKQKLLKVQKDIDNARYLESIVKMLEDVKGLILEEETIKKLLAKQQKKIDRNPNNLLAIQDFSHYIMQLLDIVKSFGPVLKELQTMSIIENDDEYAATSLVKDIQDTAKELSSKLIQVENLARDKLYQVVHAFLKIYWGEDTEEARKARGSDTTLDEIMLTASKDINMFDRFIYAAGTCSDEMMGLIAEAVKKAKERRDAKLRKDLAVIRSATEELFKAGGQTKCVYELDENGNPQGMLSDHNYKKFYEDLKAYRESLEKDPDVDKYDINDLVNQWKDKHTKRVTEFGISLEVPYFEEGGVDIYASPKKVKDRLSAAEYKYYETMMKMKAEMLDKIPAASNEGLYRCIEISSDATTALAEAGGDPSKLFETLKNKFKDKFITREDDTDYGLSQGEILDANGMLATHINAHGEVIQTVPLHYTTRIKDRSRVTTDFSKAMVAYMASSSEYVEMNKIIDALMLSKDYMLNRNVAQQEGNKTLASVAKLGKKTYVNLASKMGLATGLGGLAEDFYERNVFGKSKKNEGYLWGTKIRLDKLADNITGYSSVTGLTVNFLGAQANLYVGKLQMLIEAGGAEFFNMKDMTYADVEYFHMLPELLNEVATNSAKKSSKLGLMMEYFDVKEDFYDTIKETGFYKQPISKIIGNRSMFFMYGMGEHLLHAEGMIAVLHNKKNKVLDDKGLERNLIDAFYVEKDANGLGTLKVKAGWTQKDGNAIDEEYLDKIKGKIQYTNKSMHGAFGSLDKGMIHRYAVGRMIMNFRQWMPAHYSRRFRGRHYDTDLHQYREGYYVSTYKFARALVKDICSKKVQIATRWNELDEGQKANLKRALSEAAILAILTGVLAAIGPAKDHKGNWAMRHLIYQLSRMKMETSASVINPIAPYAFIDNILKLVKSPMASISTMEKMANLFKFTDALETVESGKYVGENKYMRDIEKAIPFVSQIMKMLDLGEENDAFLFFE